MKQTQISRYIYSLITMLFVAATLTGCSNLQQQLQAKMADPVAEDYLTKMLDAVEKNDVDAAEQLFSSEYVSREDLENGIDVIGRLWDGGTYTYQLTYSGINSSFVNGKTEKFNVRKYEVVTQDHTYSVDITYVDGKGMVGFNLTR